METKHLYIQLLIQDGDVEYIRHVVTSTKCQDLNFAVIWYVAHFWGEGKINKKSEAYILNDGTYIIICKYEMITPQQATMLTKLFRPYTD